MVTGRLGWDIGGGSGSFLHLFLKLMISKKASLDAMEVVLRGSRPSKQTGNRKIGRTGRLRSKTATGCSGVSELVCGLRVRLYILLSQTSLVLKFFWDHIEKKYESVS